MKIENYPLDKIIPYEFNNRTHPAEQVNRIANSINEFGFNQPVVIDENNVVLVGHGRLLAAQKLGLKEIPVYKKIGLSETNKKAYRILDNKLQNDSAWELKNLELELKLLEDDGFDLPAWGLDDLREFFPDNESAEEDGFEPTANKETDIMRGDLIELGVHRVLCADSSEDDPPLKPPADEFASALITDPPYGVDYEGKTREKLKIANDGQGEDATIAIFKATLDNVSRFLCDGGAVYVSVPPGPIHWEFAKALKERKIIRQTLVWLKDSMVLGHSDYHYEHEPILYGWMPSGSHYFTADRSKKSVLRFDRPKASREHPTMKPVALWGELIQNSTRKGEIILDPFLGSGTTLIAAEQLGRICYGMEIEPVYCQVIVDRYKKYCETAGKPFECKLNGKDWPQS